MQVTQVGHQILVDTVAVDLGIVECAHRFSGLCERKAVQEALKKCLGDFGPFAFYAIQERMWVRIGRLLDEPETRTSKGKRPNASLLAVEEQCKSMRSPSMQRWKTRFAETRNRCFCHADLFSVAAHAEYEWFAGEIGMFLDQGWDVLREGAGVLGTNLPERETDQIGQMLLSAKRGLGVGVRNV